MQFIPEEDITFKDNKIFISLPNIDSRHDLVLTFINWPGWKVMVDGESCDLISSPNPLLRVSLSPGDKSLAFVYKPISKLFYKSTSVSIQNMPQKVKRSVF